MSIKEWFFVFVAVLLCSGLVFLSVNMISENNKYESCLTRCGSKYKFWIKDGQCYCAQNGKWELREDVHD